MKIALPFREISSTGATLRFRFDGTEVEARPGDTVAAALLAAGVTVFRQTPVSGAPRGPFCMMGACFECLVEIDGITRQACMVQVRDGLVVGPAGEKEIRDD